MWGQGMREQVMMQITCDVGAGDDAGADDAGAGGDAGAVDAEVGDAGAGHYKDCYCGEVSNDRITPKTKGEGVDFPELYPKDALQIEVI